MKKEMLVCLVDFGDVFHVDGALAGGVLLAQAFAQHFGGSLQVNHQVRSGQLAAEKLVIAVVDFQLGIAEVRLAKILSFSKI